MLLAGLALSLAQVPQPALRLSQETLAAGETLVVSGSFFDPQERYTVILTPPVGEALRFTPEIRPDGEFLLEVRLAVPGRWQLDVQGADIFTTVMLSVTPADDDVAPETVTDDVDDVADAVTDEMPDDAAVMLDATAEPEADEQREEAEQTPIAVRPDTIVREGNAVIALAGQQLLWQLPLASGGLTSEVVVRDELAYVGHGNSLLEVRAEDGVVLRRWPLPGQVDTIIESGEALVITVQLSDGLSETLHWRDGALDETVRFDLDPAVYTFLRREAESGTISAAQDPTNPYLQLALGRAADGEAAQAHLARALEAAQTFYDLAALARELVQLGELELAGQAMDAALADFAARGYDPRLLRSRELHERYNFPLIPMQRALRDGDMALAGFWAEWLQYFVAADVPEVSETLFEYAALLGQAGDREGAAHWRERARAPSGTSVRGLVDRLALQLAEPGWYEVGALLLAVMLFHGVMLTKYWIAQNVNLRRRLAMKRRNGPLSRLLIVRYYNLGEKLTVVLMLLVTLAIVVLTTWSRQAVELPLVLRSGTLASRAAQQALSELPTIGEHGALLAGYAAQVRGDEAEALEHYRGALALAGARNNLAILTGDPALFEGATAIPEARFNAGQAVDGFHFHRRYLTGPLLYVPSEQDLTLAMVGSWQRAFRRLATEPWRALGDLQPQGMPFALWLVIVGLLMLYTLYSALWLLIPRMRWVRSAPRPFFYYVAAFFVPGSGMADELWGFAVLLAWTFFSASFFGRVFSTGTVSTGVSYLWDGYILGFIYLLNTVALIFDYRKAKTQLEQLRRDNPELAREFGLNPLKAERA